MIFVNKVLMSRDGPYGFLYATTLCGFHYITTAVAMWGAEHMGFSKPAKIPLKDLSSLVVAASMSLASLNLSLMLNSVGFYQISKLAIVPFVCVVEAFFFGKPMTLPTVIAAAIVVSGVAVVSVTDVSVRLLGALVAAVSVVASGMQQIICGDLQKRHNVTSNQLLSMSAPYQGMLVISFAPFVDKWMAKSWVFHYNFTFPAVSFIMFSCAIAIFVNISQYMCLGRFSATSFQVMGHAKTVLVLLIGWAVFGDEISWRKFTGMCLAVLGMIVYGAFASKKPAKPDVVTAKDAANLVDESKQPLLASPHGSPTRVVVVKP